ncbi:MAG: hypothetical protein PF638_13465 [Candidatus Delongbacteria bacterium]|jgi:hypothetical protein|nr:hypothetical protein [Candidatus Delongbacteria bacterium]
MKVYLHILKSNIKAVNFIGIGYFLMSFLSVTLYKIFYVGSRNFLTQEPVSLSWSILMPVFILVLLSNYMFPIMSLFESPNITVHRMVPDIRKKKMIYSGSYMLLVFIWGMFIFGFGSLMELIMFLLFNLWFISMMMTILIGYRFMYRSNKFRLLKLIFYLLPSIMSVTYSISIYNSYSILIAYASGIVFFSVIIYQIVNFYQNYKNYKEDYERNFKKGWNRILGGDFFGHLEYSTKNRSIKKLVTCFKQTKSKYTQAKLYQYSLFRNNSNRVMILSVLIGLLIYYVVISILGIKYGMFLVFYFYIYSAFGSINTFRQKELIEHLYITSGLRRKKFELTILLSYILFFIKDSIFDICSVAILYFTYKHFYENLTITPIILLFLISFIARASIIYGCWVVTLKNKDYSDLDKKRLLVY